MGVATQGVRRAHRLAQRAVAMRARCLPDEVLPEDDAGLMRVGGELGAALAEEAYRIGISPGFSLAALARMERRR